MSSLIGPSHHCFYSALHRRRLWIGHLAAAFSAYALPSWEGAKQRLDASFSRTLGRLSTDEHLGILQRLPLERVIDDTPISSFLTTLSDELDAYECQLLDLMSHHHSRPGWAAELEETSMLWGRELAQETRIAMPLNETSTLRGVAMMFQLVLHGGEFAWKPLLFRRRTDRDLQYELRVCPHRKAVASIESADLACRLDSLICKGFAQSFLSDVRFLRHTHAGYCADELQLS